MKIDLRKPCNNCPFRRSVAFPLGVDRRREIAQSLMDDYSGFPCHKTTRFGGDGDLIQHENEQLCAGAMTVLERVDRINILMRIARMTGKYHPSQLQDGDDVYSNLQDFVESDPKFLS